MLNIASPARISADRPLVLASGSRYRAELLARLRLPFVAKASAVDETPAPGEAAEALVQRLARAKAAALASSHPGQWILGSDQVASLDDAILGKPGSLERARVQLSRCSGRAVRFLTAVALTDGERMLEALDLTLVRFRALRADEIERYIETEPALDCAGSFKCESYGITLFDAIESRDPTALVGLPLIAVRRLLAEAGTPLP
ncbi:Maf family protein [Solimonas flava]|uniref:Maf family protein n=1 Tax=Solimonas flava TaxID=415849 RepID=UPI000402675E|nr:nucleoside triphosphate pyrophosphatase [Solimonas flava]